MLHLTIPNLLTLFRILLIPVFVAIFYWPFDTHYYLTSIIFLIAMATDWLDGYLARLLNQTSPLGAFLDPVADKLMVAVALILLVQSYPTIWVSIPAAIITSREIAISALREWMAELGKKQKLKVQYIGKLKTATQMTAILLLLSQDPKHITWITWISGVLLSIAALLTLWSMVIYLQIVLIELSQ